ncbi:MAG: hypothetical protein ACLGP3_03575 [Acidobacteriota bacterium]
MGIQEILSSIDREIARLRQARALLAGTASGGAAAARGAAPAKKAAKKSRLTPEGSRRIAEAVKRRWEAHRKAAAAK